MHKRPLIIVHHFTLIHDNSLLLASEIVVGAFLNGSLLATMASAPAALHG